MYECIDYNNVNHYTSHVTFSHVQYLGTHDSAVVTR